MPAFSGMADTTTQNIPPKNKGHIVVARLPRLKREDRIFINLIITYFRCISTPECTEISRKVMPEITT